VEIIVRPLAPGGGTCTHLNACSDSYYRVRYSEIDFKSPSPMILTNRPHEFRDLKTASSFTTHKQAASYLTTLAPWTVDDLMLKCVDCGVESEDVSAHYFPEKIDPAHKLLKKSETVNLCKKCYIKRSCK
jgi:hypothetical protein